MIIFPTEGQYFHIEFLFCDKKFDIKNLLLDPSGSCCGEAVESFKINGNKKISGLLPGLGKFLKMRQIKRKKIISSPNFQMIILPL
jgi:hypothetical protein